MGAGGILSFATWLFCAPLSRFHSAFHTPAGVIEFTDRHGTPLVLPFKEGRLSHHKRSLHTFPSLLIQALLISEDRTFLSHGGIDWNAKMNALWQGLRARKFSRGASTLTEQTVRMIVPRPRTLWSKWIELWEAHRLSRHFSKHHILEFYLNHVPFASHRYGVAQAARYYFGREVHTLTPKEMLALVILIRAPSAYDLKKGTSRVEGPLQILSHQMERQGILSPQERARIQQEGPLRLEEGRVAVSCFYFLDYLLRSQKILETHPASLSPRGGADNPGSSFASSLTNAFGSASLGLKRSERG